MSRVGKSVVEAAHQTCMLTVTPDTVEDVMVIYKLYSFAPPLEAGVLAILAVVFPLVGTITGTGAGVVVVAFNKRQ